MMASVLDHLDRLADEQPGKLLYSYLDVNGDPIESYTYASFLHRTQAIAGHLRKEGRFAAGDRLLLAYPPGLEMICAFFGCVRAGLIPVPVYPPSSRGFQSALYSAPSTTCPPGTVLEVRGDSQLVRLYKRGELVKIHPRKPKGGRSTDPDDYPKEKTAYALRAPDRVIQQAAALGEHVGVFAQRLLSGPLPWAKLRQGQRLLRLAERYSSSRLDAVCARALGFDLIDVRRLERMLVLAIDTEPLPVRPVEDRLVSLPAGRFARPGTAFDHRHAQPSLWSEEPRP